MKAIVIIAGLVFALLGTNVYGARMVSDPDPTGAADKCVYQEGTNPPVETPVTVVPPALTGACDVVLDGFTTGQHNLQVWFKSTVWGVASAKVPFAFAKPGAGGPGPAGLKLAP